MTSSSTSDADFNPKYWVFGTDADQPRFLHTMLRVRDFAAALRFYVEGLGMKQMGERIEIESRKVTAVFVGYADYGQPEGCIELVERWDHEGPHTHGSGYGHISVGVPDLIAKMRKLESMGVEITLRPTALIAGGPLVAFVKDSDGYSVELIQTQGS